ncbi:MAG: PD40 domain-containing protein [Candidatus Coatesbacteria bacterium]|nr:PD40 domain-containing protein [Candidatus Coatesbacteria bacterium]
MKWLKYLLILALIGTFSCGEKKKRRTDDDKDGSSDNGDKTSNTETIEEIPSSALIPIMGKSKKTGKNISFAYDPFACISNDGKLLTLQRRVKDSNTSFYLALYDLEKKEYTGNELEKIVDINEPALSPDNKKIAFIYLKDLEKTGGDVYIVGIDGQGLEQITKTKEPESQISWSNDGKSICFVRDKRHIIIYDFAEKKETSYPINMSNNKPATNINHPVFSPDNKSLAFDLPKTYDEKTTSQVIGIIDIESKNVTYATIEKGGAISPVWIKEGNYIAHVFKDATTKDEEGKNVPTHILKWAIKSGEKQGILLQPEGQVEVGERVSYSPAKKWICFSLRRSIKGKDGTSKVAFEVFALPLEKPAS